MSHIIVRASRSSHVRSVESPRDSRFHSQRCLQYHTTLLSLVQISVLDVSVVQNISIDFLTYSRSGSFNTEPTMTFSLFLSLSSSFRLMYLCVFLLFSYSINGERDEQGSND